MFSKNMCAKRVKDISAKLKCKECVERQVALERGPPVAQVSDDGSDANVAKHECAACNQSLPASSFSRAQLNNKGPGKQRCTGCLSLADAAERETSERKRVGILQDARSEMQRIEFSGGSAQRKLAAAAKEAAAEATAVTGLKPTRVGGRGRGRSRQNPNSMLRGGRLL